LLKTRILFLEAALSFQGISAVYIELSSTGSKKKILSAEMPPKQDISP
jgi:hypothetical protein